MARSIKPYHIVATPTHWGECLNCGAKLDDLDTGAWTPIDILLKSMRLFEQQHAGCLPKQADTQATALLIENDCDADD
jgi:hypothetical protein